MSLYIFLLYHIYHLCFTCIDFYDLSAWSGYWFDVYRRRCIYKFLNVCPFDYTAVAGSGKVGPVNHGQQKRSTEGCSKFKSPETRQVQERLVSTLEHMQVPKWDRTRCPEGVSVPLLACHTHCRCSLETNSWWKVRFSKNVKAGNTATNWYNI